MPYRILILALLYLLAGVDAPAEPPIHRISDIVYKQTPGGDLHLDLYYPEAEPTGKYPVVIYTHGGGWAAGSKNKALAGSRMSLVVRGLTENGFCVAAVNYRLCNTEWGTTIRDCVVDAKDAIRFLSRNSNEYFVDTERVFTFGDSAGGQLAQMLLLAPPDLFPGDAELQGYGYRMIVGVSWYGPCDFEKTELFNHDGRDNFRDRFGARVLGQNTDPKDKLRLYREVSPVNYLSASSPPLLMIQGDRDTTIPVHHAYAMQERAKAVGAPVEIMIVKHAGHNWRQADPPQPIQPSQNEIIERTVNFLVMHREEKAP